MTVILFAEEAMRPPWGVDLFMKAGGKDISTLQKEISLALPKDTSTVSYLPSVP